ncbi:MAG: hypothetical protein R8L07_03480 [Alphaproteobacteria bacterium]|nr:hypothetical protein [Alphaproteobacteria bacterium]
MRIKFLTSLSGPRVTVSRGDIRDWPDKEALRLIAAGMAEAAPAGAETAQASLPGVETAVNADAWTGAGGEGESLADLGRKVKKAAGRYGRSPRKR